MAIFRIFTYFCNKESLNDNDMASAKTITPAMRRSIDKARREYANGETVSCSSPEEMQRYFDSL